MTITAAADGSALGNPGPAGWAWYIDEDTWRAGGWPHGTNNMGELKAVLDLLESTAEDADQHLVILCDSQYVINSVTKWMPGWKRKGWRKKDGKPVMNVELLQAIDRALAGRSVEFEWVKGHSGHAMNEAADKRANAAATAYSRNQDPQIGPGYRGAPPSATAAVSAAPESPAGSARPAVAPEASASPERSGRDGSAGSARRARPTPVAPADDDDLFSLFEDISGDPGPASITAVDPDATAFEQVTTREQALLTDLVRSDPPSAAELLHPSFTEIGASGRTYDRDDILAALAPLQGVESSDFVADELAPGVVLLRYRTTGPQGSAERSSIWLREGDRWLLRHHQGTPVDENR